MYDHIHNENQNCFMIQIFMKCKHLFFVRSVGLWGIKRDTLFTVLESQKWKAIHYICSEQGPMSTIIKLPSSSSTSYSLKKSCNLQNYFVKCRSDIYDSFFFFFCQYTLLQTSDSSRKYFLRQNLIYMRKQDITAFSLFNKKMCTHISSFGTQKILKLMRNFTKQ